MVVIIEAQRRDKNPNTSHNVRMQAGRDECMDCNQDRCLDVNIRSLLQIIFVPVQSQVQTNSSLDCVKWILFITSFVKTERQEATQTHCEGDDDETDLEESVIYEAI